MRVLHITVEQDKGWLIAQGLEEPGVITQAKTYDELMANIREVIELMLNQTDVLIELIVPPQPKPRGGTKVKSARKAQTKSRWKAHV